MTGIRRDRKVRRYGPSKRHEVIEDDFIFDAMEILRGDDEAEKAELANEFDKDTSIWKIERIISGLREILDGHDLPSDPYVQYCSKEYAENPELSRQENGNNIYALLGCTWGLSAQVKMMTNSALCAESAAALELAVMIKGKIKKAVFDEAVVGFLLSLAMIMGRIKMLEMEREAHAGRSRMDGGHQENEQRHEEGERVKEALWQAFLSILKEKECTRSNAYRILANNTQSEEFCRTWGLPNAYTLSTITTYLKSRELPGQGG